MSRTVPHVIHPRAGADGDHDHHRPRRRHALVVVLTFLTGSADAIGFLALGGAFSSVMTGNMVLLGLSAGRGDAELAVTSGCAIASFIVGVLAGARLAGRAEPDDPVWPRRVTRALVLELLVFLVFLVVWEATLRDRAEQVDLALLMLSAAALGIQSSAVQRFGVPGLSSTYLTGTLTSLIAGVAVRSPWRSLRPNAHVLVSLVTGAAVGALVARHLPALAPVLLIVPLVLVIAAASRLAGKRSTDAPTGRRAARRADRV
ncbi:YoaK family protein [Micromonospora sp. WMMD812]|uniref:YoaK family protein n=1 Tax=Micromonospora sp. WMMD812 TaxID=3015152 RepID=UPI00248BC450|nr:YoaK family protein [Micromonospora sp. WMMD812]WBB68493.1 YoaK family protein [Micromonospora sp. WMMD812]